MQKILLLKDIYSEGFKNWTNMILKKYFKLFFWFCMGMLTIVMYAFVYRLFTGFAFD